MLWNNCNRKHLCYCSSDLRGCNCNRERKFEKAKRNTQKKEQNNADIKRNKRQQIHRLVFFFFNFYWLGLDMFQLVCPRTSLERYRYMDDKTLPDKCNNDMVSYCYRTEWNIRLVQRHHIMLIRLVLFCRFCLGHFVVVPLKLSTLSATFF